MKTVSTGVPSLLVSLISVVVFLGPTVVAKAEFLRIEATGHYRLRDAMRSKVIARDEAVALARWEGVSAVAFGLIRTDMPEELETSTPEQPLLDLSDPMQEPALIIAAVVGAEPLIDEPSSQLVSEVRKALGRNLLPYIRRYRILDDRGEVPILVEDESELRIEYVVVVEILVDVDRVQSALEAAGLIVVSTSTEAGAPIAVEMLGLSRFEAVEMLRTGLRDEFGATDVQTVEYARGRQLLRVEGPFGPEALSAMLARWQSPQLFLEPIGVDSQARRIRLMGRWFPKPEPEPEPVPPAEPEAALEGF
jgi:hypothetical protein